MIRRLLFLVFSLCVFNIVVAQGDDRPGWLYNLPKPGNTTYLYVVERGGGVTVTDAANNALLKVLRTTMMRIGAPVSWEEVNKAIQHGDDWATLSEVYDIPINKVCEFVERKTDRGYIVAVLCQVAKSGNVYPEFDYFADCTGTKVYNNGAALLKSAFIPGWGQMSKRHYGSGVFTLLGEVAFVGGAIGTYFMAQQQLSIMRSYNVNFNNFMRAESRYQTYRYANIACLSAAGALYAFNLIRAYTMSPKYIERRLSFAPTLMQSEMGLTSGICLTFNF